MDITQGQLASITVTLKDGGGSALTSITPAEMIVTIKKEGIAPYVKSLTLGDSLVEIDAALMPGIYQITLDVTDTDTVGTIILLLREDALSGVAAQTLLYTVVPEQIDTLLRRALGLLQENMRITDYVYDINNNLTGAVVSSYPTSLDATDMTNPIGEYTLVATYDGQNRLLDYKVTRNP